jgi:hypothetical protein
MVGFSATEEAALCPCARSSMPVSLQFPFGFCGDRLLTKVHRTIDAMFCQPGEFGQTAGEFFNRKGTSVYDLLQSHLLPFHAPSGAVRKVCGSIGFPQSTATQPTYWSHCDDVLQIQGTEAPQG